LAQNRYCKQTHFSLCDTTYEVTKKLHSCTLVLQKTKPKDSQLNMTSIGCNVM